MSDQVQQKRVELTDAEAAHMRYIQKQGLPTVERVQQLKERAGKQILDASAIGAENVDALDAFSVFNEWLMIRTDKRLMEAFTRVAMMDVQGARNQAKEKLN